ncbi:MAG: type VI secretion system baseplate subunit TssK [Spirochaetaceae bacterium]|jgi:type VI secretion system ImpJ/VasE family protein|nr:type VI secretion system baseplate subunit TssK [Spirochaetaceae bacterium]
MQFNELLHWSDGQFLQPHHFQYLQRVTGVNNRANRSLSLSYPYGLVDFELDREALSGARVVVKRFSAITQGGQELSMPGNCVISPLDLTKVMTQNANEIEIYAAVPVFSEFDANLSENNNTAEKKRYILQKRQIRDENFGNNEITLVTRRINARLTTNFDDNKDMDLLPIAKLSIVSHDKSGNSITLNEKFVPPFIHMNDDNPILGLVTGLLVDMRRCRDKTLDALSSAKSAGQSKTGIEALNEKLWLRILTLYETRLSELNAMRSLCPCQLYLELISLLAELMSLEPDNSVTEIPRYNHEDCYPQFTSVIKDIRSFILASGAADYRKFDFFPINDGQYLFTKLEMEDLIGLQEIYLAVKTDAQQNTVISEIETGDTFKLINPESKTMRVRGVQLVAERYPPRYLPILKNTTWFHLKIHDSTQVWREIREEKGIIIDYAVKLFPALEAALYITLRNELAEWKK